MRFLNISSIDFISEQRLQKTILKDIVPIFEKNHWESFLGFLGVMQKIFFQRKGMIPFFPKLSKRLFSKSYTFSEKIV